MTSSIFEYFFPPYFAGRVGHHVRCCVCLLNRIADTGPVASRRAIQYVLSRGIGLARRTKPDQLHELGGWSQIVSLLLGVVQCNAINDDAPNNSLQLYITEISDFREATQYTYTHAHTNLSFLVERLLINSLYELLLFMIN